MLKFKTIAIIGTAGVPANYGGFETLAENLVKHHDAVSLKNSLSVYCSSKRYPLKQKSYLAARLHYMPFNANGVQSIPYDVLSLFAAAWRRSDVILLLGVSGAIALPLLRLFSSAHIVCNIDGIEWSRRKWGGLARRFLQFSENLAVRFAHEVIADNAAIAEYISQVYGVESHLIAYGGDHAIAVDSITADEYMLPESYAFSVCRIEPENNVDMILESFSRLRTLSFVMVGNWNNSEYGRSLRAKHASCGNLFLIDPIYHLGKLKALRLGAMLYVHGHSAGGTNPSLVEAMHFGLPVLAFDCAFNRSTTEDKAVYFRSGEELISQLSTVNLRELDRIGPEMLEVAQRKYRWRDISEAYFALLIGSENGN